MLRKSMTSILSCIIAVAIGVNLLGSIVNASTNGHSRDDAYSWAKSQINKSLDYDGVYGCQCVDLIYFYCVYLGHSELIGGNACDYANKSLPSGWKYVYSNYLPGDIAVFKTNVSGWTGSYGHVGIITYADADRYKCVNQNYNNQGWCTENEFPYYTLGCAIRPDFGTIPTPVSVTWAASSYKATEIREGKILVSKDAIINGAVMDNVSLIGIDVYDASGNRVGGKSEEPYRGSVTHVDIWYDFSEELGLPITPGTVYTYCFWANVNGTKYYSDRETVTCPPVYTVSFNSNGGSSVSDLKIGKNQTIKTLPTTTRSGYVFDGWYTSASGGTKLTTSTAITGNVTYYAHWTAKVSITTQPKNYTGAVGSRATFSVAAQGTGLSYQWQYCSGGTTWNNFGSNTPTVSLTVSNTHNGMKYRCIVKSSSGGSVTSNVATISVINSLSITTQPKDYTGTIGSKASFSVAAKGTGLSYQWQYYSGGTWKNFGSNKSTASLTVSTSHNEMKYRCIVKDSTGKTVTSNVATIHITNMPLSITTQPKNYTGSVGSRAMFTVAAQGNGLSYQWQYYSGGTWKNFGSNKSIASLTVSNSHNGVKYRCIVKDSSGKSVTSNTATIKVV